MFNFNSALGQPTLVEAIALNEVIFQRPCGPLAELNPTLGFHTVANRNDEIKIVVIDVSANASITFLPNYPEIPDS